MDVEIGKMKRIFLVGVFASTCACHAGDMTNLALGKPYTFSTKPNYRLCTDPDDRVQLTDGGHSYERFWTHKEAVGWLSAKRGAQMITVDLGVVSSLSGFAYTLAAGDAGVSWPTAIGVYVSEDRKSWTFAGDLWSRSTARTGAPKSNVHSIYRAFDDAMPCRGRYVAFLHCNSGMGFCDEVEVFGGEDPAAKPAKARTFADPFDDVFRIQVQGVISRDAQRFGVVPPEIEIPAGIGADAFRTELPLSAGHAAVWAANAPRLRAAGFSAPVFWKNGRWDELDPFAVPPKPMDAGTPLEVEMMRGETRAETINIMNPTDAPIEFRVAVEGLPESSHVDVKEVLFTLNRGVDGLAFGATASALKPGRGASVSFTVPAGVSKQVWISFARPTGAAGVFEGTVRAVGGGVSLAHPIWLNLHGIDFPERPRLHVGGWDYTDGGATRNRRPQALAADKREMLAVFTDTVWGSPSVFPGNAKFDAAGNLTNSLDFSALDAWVALWPEARVFAAFHAVLPGQRFYGEAEGTERFMRMVGTYFRAWHDHLAKVNGGREAMVLALDEPRTPKAAKTSMLWNAAIRAGAPGLKTFVDPIFDKVAQVPQELIDSVDVLCPARTSFLQNGEQAAWCKMTAPGTKRELALYSCLTESRRLDPEHYYRAQFWEAFRMGAKGSFFWQLGDGGGAAGSFAAFGQSHAECSPYFAGTVDGDVMQGKQSEGIREGVEDHELLSMLQDAAKRIRTSGRDAGKIESFLAAAPSRVLDGQKSTAWRDGRTSAFDTVRVEALRLLANAQ